MASDKWLAAIASSFAFMRIGDERLEALRSWSPDSTCHSFKGVSCRFNFSRRRVSTSSLPTQMSPGHRLRKSLGPWSLTALGIGAIIGTGIFILTGTAAAGEVLEVHSLLKAPLLDVLLHGTKALGTAGRPGAGPGIALSFLLVAIACALAGLCYAELASMIPIAGSAYTYSYATLGEIVAWIIGWDLILEYAVSNMAVAVGFSAYVDSLLRGFGIELPRKLMQPMFMAGQVHRAPASTFPAS